MIRLLRAREAIRKGEPHRTITVFDVIARWPNADSETWRVAMETTDIWRAACPNDHFTLERKIVETY